MTSADGRWEFTLFDGPGDPLIHQLDVTNGTQERIALEELDGYDLGNAGLRLDGGTVAIGDLAKLDPETQRVTMPPFTPVEASTPRPRATVTATPAPPLPAGGSSPWPFVACGLLAIGVAGLFVARRRSVQEVEDIELTVHHADEHPSLRE